MTAPARSPSACNAAARAASSSGSSALRRSGPGRVGRGRFGVEPRHSGARVAVAARIFGGLPSDQKSALELGGRLRVYVGRVLVESVAEMGIVSFDHLHPLAVPAGSAVA